MARPTAADSSEKIQQMDECFPARALVAALERDIKPRDIMTRRAFRNAMVVVMLGLDGCGVAFNAMARAAEVN